MPNGRRESRLHISRTLLRHVSNQSQRDPVAYRLGDVSEHCRLRVEHIDDCIQASIIVQVANRKAAPLDGNGKAARGRCTDAREPSVALIAKEQRLLRETCSPLILVHRRIDMSVGNQNIFPTVVIEIYKARAPSQKWNCSLALSRLKSNISPVTTAVVVKQDVRVVRKVCDVEINAVIIVVI